MSNQPMDVEQGDDETVSRPMKKRKGPAFGATYAGKKRKAADSSLSNDQIAKAIADNPGFAYSILKGYMNVGGNAQFTTGVKEMKYFDTSRAAAGLTSAGIANIFASSVTAVQEGTGASGRVGDAILVYKVQLQGVLWANATTAAYGRCLRVVGFVNKATRGSDPTFVGSSGAVFTSPNINTLNNPLTDSQFDIFHDKNVVFAPSFNAGTAVLFDPHAIPINVAVEFKEPIKVEYIDSTGAITDQIKNSIYWGIGCHLPSVIPTGMTYPFLQASARIWYKDAS